MSEETNRKIAEWLGTGCVHEKDTAGWPPNCKKCGQRWDIRSSAPLYSSDPAACLELIEAVRAKEYGVETWAEREGSPENAFSPQEPYLATVYGPKDTDVWRGRGDTLPAAVAAAVVKLIEGIERAKPTRA